jgi:hypothetical protein
VTAAITYVLGWLNVTGKAYWLLTEGVSEGTSVVSGASTLSLRLGLVQLYSVASQNDEDGTSRTCERAGRMSYWMDNGHQRFRRFRAKDAGQTG